MTEVNTKGEVLVENKLIGKLSGFLFQMDPLVSYTQVKELPSTAIEALQAELKLRADRMYNAPDTEFDFTEQGGLMWGQYGVGKLLKGDETLAPEIEVFIEDIVDKNVKDKVHRRLRHFMDRKISSAFEPLFLMRDDDTIIGGARDLALRLYQSLGVIPRSVVAHQIKELDQDSRSLLRKHGVRFGQYTLFQPLMLKPAPTRLRLLLWALFEELDEFPEAPPPGLVTIGEQKKTLKGYYPRAGYRLAGDRAIRIDMLERVADIIRTHDVKSGFEANLDMLSISGMTLDQFANLMQGLGFSVERGEREKEKIKTGDGLPEITTPEVTSSEITTPEVTSSEITTPEITSPEELVEVFYTFKWIPKTRVQPKQHIQHKKRPANIKKPHSKVKKPKQPNRVKSVDPDNPFAVLKTLKDKH